MQVKTLAGPKLQSLKTKKHTATQNNVQRRQMRQIAMCTPSLTHSDSENTSPSQPRVYSSLLRNRKMHPERNEKSAINGAKQAFIRDLKSRNFL
jgi:hypothetical protein